MPATHLPARLLQRETEQVPLSKRELPQALLGAAEEHRLRKIPVPVLVRNAGCSQPGGHFAGRPRTNKLTKANAHQRTEVNGNNSVTITCSSV